MQMCKMDILGDDSTYTNGQKQTYGTKFAADTGA